ncbi:hypothetical protein [Hymenobacter rubidus]|uniref:hypothetical protein n=1 Tax=Hymenobacter rubidus TaxID=1441626 RepID=UPI00191E158E|nr:hypothetical protein [Hymenobacter rubidus]
MPHFTRLPLGSVLQVVEAVQWFPGLAIAGVSDEAPGHPGGGWLLAMPPHAFLTSGRSRITLFAGDWVVTENSGRQHVCQDVLFRQQYQLLETKPAGAPQSVAH